MRKGNVCIVKEGARHIDGFFHAANSNGTTIMVLKSGGVMKKKNKTT